MFDLAFLCGLDTSPLNLCRTCAFQRPAVLLVSVNDFEGLLTCPPCVSCSHLVTPGTDSIAPLNVVRLWAFYLIKMYILDIFFLFEFCATKKKERKTPTIY